MYIKVIAYPKSKKESFRKIGEDTFEAKIKEPAERNQANKRIIELVADYFKVSVRKVKIVNGHYHPKKLLSIED